MEFVQELPSQAVACRGSGAGLALHAEADNF